jgi:hypothetical protein
MSQHDDQLVERVARAILPVIMAQVTGRAPRETYDTTIEENREAAREVSRAALSALPERELLAEALEALKPFAIFGEIITFDPAMAVHPDDTPASIILFSDGVRRTLTFGDLRRARAAADKIRAALGVEK